MHGPGIGMRHGAQPRDVEQSMESTPPNKILTNAPSILFIGFASTGGGHTEREFNVVRSILRKARGDDLNTAVNGKDLTKIKDAGEERPRARSIRKTYGLPSSISSGPALVEVVAASWVISAGATLRCVLRAAGSPQGLMPVI